MTASTLTRSTALRDALALAARAAATACREADPCKSVALLRLGGLFEHFCCCDDAAMTVLAAVGEKIRAAVRAAAADPWVIAAIEAAAQRGDEK